MVRISVALLLIVSAARRPGAPTMCLSGRNPPTTCHDGGFRRAAPRQARGSVQNASTHPTAQDSQRRLPHDRHDVVAGAAAGDVARGWEREVIALHQHLV